MITNNLSKLRLAAVVKKTSFSFANFKYISKLGRFTKFMQGRSQIKTFSTNNYNSNFNDPFPKYEKKDFYDEQDLIINIGEKETFKGLLVICPTPIGNINDISIRQYEALKNGDILACEDTRKTGKLLELVQLKKMKEKFYSEFGISFEEFINKGGLDMSDEQIQNEFLKKTSENSENSTGNFNSTQEMDDFENYHNFYETNEDVDKHKDFAQYQEKLEKREKERGENPNTDEKSKTKTHSINANKNNVPSKDLSQEEILHNLANLKNKNTPDNLSHIVKEVNLNYSEEDPKNLFQEWKKELEEPVTSDYYSHVKDSVDFVKRKKVIENSEEDFKPFIEPLAEKYDENLKLSYKLRNKAKFIMGMNKKYTNKQKKNIDEDKQEEKDDSKIEEELEEEMSLHNGLDENYFGVFKRRIKAEKEKKGRGLLVPFNQENEEKRIPKLIRAMKMGLRVVLVSDAGTPTISDPGYRLVKEATKNGIIIEPIPGPSAVLTALSASALPTDKFMFMGYLPKTPGDKVAKLEEIKRIGVTTVVFESPNRIMKTLETMKEIFGENHSIYLGFELTKKFETHMYGGINSIMESLEKKEEVKGEITMIVSNFEKTEEEIKNEKNLNDEIKIEALEFARKVNSTLKLSDKELRNLITEICGVSNFKANKIVNTVKNRESSILKFLNKSQIKHDKVETRPLDEFLAKENTGEGKLKNFVKVIKKANMKGDNLKATSEQSK